MGNPAARMGDYAMHDRVHCHAPVHGSNPLPHPPQPIALVTGCPTVRIGGQNAVRLGDQTNTCMPPACVPVKGGTIGLGSMTVNIGGKPAARVGDLVSFSGCMGSIPCPTGKVVAPGCATVTIGG